MTVSEQLADRIHQISYDKLPQEVVYWAKISIIDTLGVALAGSTEACARIATRVIAGDASGGPSVVFGTRRKVAALDAAQINGTAAHAMDFDASSNIFAGHPSVQLLPALFAAAEMVDARGSAFLTAYVAGFEAQFRIARGIEPYQNDKGWFTSSSVGVFGAAAAVSHLLGLSPDQTAQALALAAMLACGSMSNAGTMTKPFAAGHAARNGLISALLVRDGFTSALDALEDRRGYFNLFNGAGNFDIDAMLPNWGEPYEVLETAVGIKRHPCCGVLQSAVDVMGDLVSEHHLHADNVERVDALLVTKRLGHVSRPDPRSSVDAKFSTQYCVARTLERGRLQIDDFEGDAFRDASTRELMTRVVPSEHPSMGAKAARSEQGGAELRVTTKDGRVVSGFAKQPFGRVPGEPLSKQMLHAKFLDCAGRVLSSSGATDLLALLDRIDSVPHIRQLSDIMSSSAQGQDTFAGSRSAAQ